MRQQIPALPYQPGGGRTAFVANGMSAQAPAGPSRGPVLVRFKRVASLGRDAYFPASAEAVLVLVFQVVALAGASSYSSWRRSQKTCSPSSLRPVGVRSSRP